MVYRTLGLARSHVRTNFLLKVPWSVDLSKDRTGMIEYGFYGEAMTRGGPVAEPSGWRDGRSALGCLDSFTRLHDAPDAEIGEFAQEWGVLGFCEHGLPGIHASCPPALHFPSSLDPSSTPIMWLFGEERPYQESTEDWRGLARHLRAIRNAANATINDEEPSFDDWRHLYWPLPSSAPRAPIFGKSAPRLPARQQFDLDWFARFSQAPSGSPEGISLTVNRLLELAHIGPTVHFEKSDYWLSFALMRPTKEAPVFPWPGETLFPALVAELAGSLVSESQLRCAQCGELFLWEKMYPKKMPRRDRGAYCSVTCRKTAKGAQNAASMRRKRA